MPHLGCRLRGSCPFISEAVDCCCGVITPQAGTASFEGEKRRGSPSGFSMINWGEYCVGLAVPGDHGGCTTMGQFQELREVGARMFGAVGFAIHVDPHTVQTVRISSISQSLPIVPWGWLTSSRRWRCALASTSCQRKELDLVRRRIMTRAGTDEHWVQYEPPQPSQISLGELPSASAGGKSFAVAALRQR